MYEFRCTENGFYYYDPIIREERFASNTLLFLLGYCRTFGDIYVSDKLFIPSTILDPDGKPQELVNFDFQFAARSYLTNLAKVDTLDIGDRFELYGLTLALEKIGFMNYYKSSNSNYSSLNRVPHIPLFTKRSQDYKRIYDILTQKEYWGDGDPSKGNPDISKQEKTNNRIKQEELYPKYSVFNTSYKGEMAEALDLYNSFGSLNYINKLYPLDLKPIQEYDDMCSWFVWDSLSFTTLYQFSLGALYGMSQLGYGSLPFNARPTLYAPGFKYLQYIDEAFFWFQNTPLDLVGLNDLFYLDTRIFRIDTYTEDEDTVYETNRILSSSVDQNYIYDTMEDCYSVDGGDTWMTLQEFSHWASEHDGAYPVTDDTSSIPLYRGSLGLSLPLSDWEWPE